MSEERELIARGYPLEDAITMCHSMRRTGELKEFMRQEKNPHVCTCCGNENCRDCPNKTR